jgi:hypothetical protein
MRITQKRKSILSKPQWYLSPHGTGSKSERYLTGHLCTKWLNNWLTTRPTDPAKCDPQSGKPPQALVSIPAKFNCEAAPMRHLNSSSSSGGRRSTGELLQSHGIAQICAAQRRGDGRARNCARESPEKVESNATSS